MAERGVGIKFKILIIVVVGIIIFASIISLLFIQDIIHSSELAIEEKSHALMITIETIQQEMRSQYARDERRMDKTVTELKETIADHHKQVTDKLDKLMLTVKNGHQ